LSGIDLSKLSPAPWEQWGYDTRTICLPPTQELELAASCESLGTMHSIDDAAFIVLARNAFDVMLRRGWDTYFSKSLHQWTVFRGAPELRDYPHSWHDDPFTALVEADKWMRENVEKVTGAKMPAKTYP
jgi:hypothetical protein